MLQVYLLIAVSQLESGIRLCSNGGAHVLHLDLDRAAGNRSPHLSGGVCTVPCLQSLLGRAATLKEVL